MPPEPCTFTLVTDAEQALRLVEPLVASDPEALSVLASVTRSIVVDPGRYRGPRWWVGSDARGHVVAAAMHTPPHQVHVALATPDEARTLAADLADLADLTDLAAGQPCRASVGCAHRPRPSPRSGRPGPGRRRR